MLPVLLSLKKKKKKISLKKFLIQIISMLVTKYVTVPRFDTDF